MLLLEILKEFAHFVIENYYHEVKFLLKEVIDVHGLRNEKRQTLELNLFWWFMLHQANKDPRLSVVNEYLAENQLRFVETPIVPAWLRAWEQAIPKIYYVGYTYSDSACVAIDLLDEKSVDVIVFDPTRTPLQKGEFVAGTLIPIGDSLYFPINDFYHFDMAASRSLALPIQHQYQKYKEKTTAYEAFIHILSIALQIEKIVYERKKDEG